jgi:O-antigen/teichoic acid export membrane protein
MYSILAKTWTLLANALTLLLIASYLPADVQGYYYTFGSLLALQTFVELAFSLVITQFASHEWAHLRFDASGRIAGEPVALARLISLGRLALKWYAAASGIFVLSVGLAGYVFFSFNPNPGVDWVAPWSALVFVAGCQLSLLPVFALLEGCNQVATVNLFRLVQGLTSSIALWTVLVIGGGLWIAPASLGAGFVSNVLALGLGYKPFLIQLVRSSLATRMGWRSEIWPMQWRLAISGLVVYFAFSLFNPVMFYYHGAVVAGQMGMTWALAGALGSLAMIWIQVKVPLFGSLIAKKQYDVLDGVFFRTSVISFVVVFCAALGVWGMVYLLNVLNHPFAERLLPPLPTGLFFLAAILMQVSQCQSAYLRAHKREPLVVLGVVGSLVIGLLVWLLGARYGPMGAAIGYLAVVALLVLPWETAIWARCRVAWHQG